MSKKLDKKQNVEESPFTHFERSCEEEFSFLTKQYNFIHVSTDINPPECAITYYNSTTGVRVFYEWGGQPWVQLIELKRTGIAVSEVDRRGLDFLINLRCPEHSKKLKSSYKENVTRDIRHVLRVLSYLLSEYGQDVLLGKFEVFSDLKRLEKKNERKVNKELFGSETGESRES